MAKPVPLLGRIAIQLKLITYDQLAEVTGAQFEGDSRRLGELLVGRGFISDRQLQGLLRKQAELVAKHRAKQSAVPAGGIRETVRNSAPRSLEQPTARALPTREVSPSEVESVANKPLAPSAQQVAPPVADTRSVAPPAAPPPVQTAAPIRTPEASVAEPAAPRPTLVSPSAADEAKLSSILRDAVAKGVSDIHVHGGASLRHRVAGVMHEADPTVLSGDETERLVAAALSEDDRCWLAEHGEIDACFQLDGVGRFRANFYRQQRGYDAVFRFIPQKVPSLESLGLPESLAKHTQYHQGMVLVTGPTGCGKSSTLASLVDLINEGRGEHILTIEDPIEFVHPSKLCVVNQRSVKRHTETFARALRAALREDPDVIVIGELRDHETISLALTAAETGHFVLGTLHTNSTIRTINRLVGVFPSDQQDQVRNMLSETLRAVVSQRLIPRADGQGRAAALETLVVNRAVGNLIRENKTFQIHSILQTGASQGMGLMDHSVRKLVDEGVVDREEALRHVDDPKNLGMGGS